MSNFEIDIFVQKVIDIYKCTFESKKNPYLDIEKYIDQIICRTKNDYSEIENDVKKLYRKNKLNYKAEKIHLFDVSTQKEGDL